MNSRASCPITGASPHARGTAHSRHRRHAARRCIPAFAGNRSTRTPGSSPATVHPRMRGEQRLMHLAIAEGVGASPHARGTGCGEPAGHARRRCIPACAGNRRAVITSSACRAVHPRMRGEQCLLSESVAVRGGASPHARGTGPWTLCRARWRRCIPACAGNRVGPARSSRRAPVHPRMRGEQYRNVCAPIFSNGASPHARGTARRPRRTAPPSRCIPACAGNRRITMGGAVVSSVHPRMRGEQGAVETAGSVGDGASPHARGTDGLGPAEQAPARCIPACAGNRSVASVDLRVWSVHPRMRGEQASAARPATCQRGASPHARGTDRGLLERIVIWRCIPACAGNRARHPRERQRHPVHPRMRGEQFPSRIAGRFVGGASPHARGTAATGRQVSQPVRCIPACAGNSSRRTRWRSAPPVHPRMRGEQLQQAGIRPTRVGASPHARGTGPGPKRRSIRRRCIPACAGNSGIFVGSG